MILSLCCSSLLNLGAHKQHLQVADMTGESIKSYINR